MMQPGQQPQQPQGMPPESGASMTGTQAMVAWQGDQIMVDMGQGPQQVEDIGAALQMVLDAYKQSSQGQPGEADYLAAFSENQPPAQERQPTMAQRAGAMRG
jgi:hypothetical protein